MKNKKVVIGVASAVVAIIVVIAIVFGMVQYHKKQLEILAQEAEKIASMDITKQNIDMEIKTKGSYGKVESTMKNYMNNTKTVCQQIEELCNNAKLDEILSADNIKTDGPEFVQTKQKIQDFQTQINDLMNQCTELLKEENILGAIEEQKGLSKHYKELYKTYMLNDETKQKLQATSEEIKEASNQVNIALKGIGNIVNFLSENKDSWEISDGKIQFKNLSALTEYYKVLNSIRTTTNGETVQQ